MMGWVLTKRAYFAFAPTPPGLPRKKKKIFVPTDNPEFNFFSLLIGPRGSTQKRLQEETGAHINIRGA